MFGLPRFPGYNSYISVGVDFKFMMTDSYDIQE